MDLNLRVNYFCLSTNQQINKSTNQQINKSTNQQINKSTNQQINKSTISTTPLSIFLKIP